MALTAEQINNINDLQSKLNKATENLNAAIAARDAARTAAKNCQSARDAKTGGYNKNKACHIDTLNKLNNDWGNAEQTVSSMQSVFNTAKKNLEDYMNLIEEQNKASADALMGDAAFNQAQTSLIQKYNTDIASINAQKDIALNIASAEAATKAKVEQQKTEEENKNKKILIIAGIAAGSIILFLIIFAIYKNYKSKTTE